MASAGPDLENRDRRDIYEYVKEQRRVGYEEVRRALGFDERAFGHHVAVLRRDGYLKKTDPERVDDATDRDAGNPAMLEVAYIEESGERFETDEVDFTIRVAQQFDLSGLVGVIRQVAGDGTYIEAEQVADLVDYEEVVVRRDEVHSRMFFVAIVDEDVVGWVHLSIPSAEKLSHTAKLTVGVLEEFRGHGIGRALLDRGTEWAAENEFEKLYNSVPATNDAAIGFLESSGWETEAVRSDHYKIDDEYVDEVMMALRI